ncbi:dynamin-1-like [Aphidius gifuensis]|uniref:dynamin-1-like n=1 Tax=Aphidius gifuensis TaxID=684658 RepID=UPI001CDC5E37|nr:dynamin-1-like [Aphidius gifuensis]
MANNESMGKLIPFMNQIQDIFTKHAVSVKFDLPQIVVIGSQSAGKSSVLESFVGRDFLPRGSGIITRRPLILQLITNTISDEEYAEFEHTENKKFQIDEVCKEIEDETDKSTDGDKGINPKPITLKIYSPTVLNLTLVDLPGLTKVPVEGQPDDIAVQIRKMVLEYITKENALILAVTPGNIDLATSDALELAKEVDPSGTRTIGVITKLDMMSEGSDARAVLENKLYPLSRGYVGVINRNQSDIDKKKSIADAIESEKKFFNTHAAYKFFSDKLGIHCLQRILNEQLTNHIRDKLPGLRNELLAELSNIIKHLGEKDYQLDDTSLKIKSLSEMHRAVLNVFNNQIGFYESDEVSTIPNGGCKIKQLMHKSLPHSISRVILADEELRKEIIGTIQNVRGARKGLFLPDKAFENVAKAQIRKLQEPCIKYVSLVIKELTNILLYCIDHMSAYPKLRAETKRILMSRVKDCEKKCKEHLDISIQIHLSYLNTANEELINFKKAEETAVNQMKINHINIRQYR